MKLSEYPLGVLAYFAGLDGDGRVIRSNQLISHNHSADYSDINHKHDADYSDINHKHDADYSDINHKHDADYAPFSRRVRMGFLGWAGGQDLPYRALVSTEQWTFSNTPNVWGVVARDDGYVYFFRTDGGVVYNVSLHNPISYNITREIEGNYTYIVIPVGATGLNVSGREYQGFAIGMGGYQ